MKDSPPPQKMNEYTVTKRTSSSDGSNQYFYFHLLKEQFAYQQSPTEMGQTDMNTIKYREKSTIYNRTDIYIKKKNIFILSITCQCEATLELK